MKHVILLLVLVACVCSCKKKDSSDPAMDFTSLHMTDINGQPIGATGVQPDDDFQQENWDQWVYGLFTPMDTANLTDTYEGTAVFGTLYPNPVLDIQTFGISVDTPTNVKLVIIDPHKNVKLRASKKIIKGFNHVVLDYTSLDTGYYRLYYTTSAEGAKFYYRGHADLKVFQY